VSGEKPLTSILSAQAGRGSEPNPSFCVSGERKGPALKEWKGKGRLFVVAVDGPAASGKGTLARRLAERFGLAVLDTGSLYRATARLVLDENGDPADPATAEAAAKHVDLRLLDDPRLRADSVARAASVVAAIPEVRRELLEAQRNFAAHPPAPARGAVLDGRDIGTVVCPQADVKLFITAKLEARAARRVKELREQGAPAIYENVLQDLNERDARDSGRGAAPLKAADDAHVIDTTMLDADEVFERVCRLVAHALEEKEWQQ